MATLKIYLKGNRFEGTNNVNVEEFSSTFVKGNSWIASIDEKGNVCCMAHRVYNGRLHRIKLTIKKGWVKITLTIDGQGKKLLKSYRLEKYETEGIIGLPAGYIDSRMAYFRRVSFQRFLDEHNLTSVRCIDANGVYLLIEKTREGKTMFEETIESTDGESETIYKGFTTEDEILYKVEVTNATWVIKKVIQTDGQIQRILYTTKNPKEIPNLPV